MRKISLYIFMLSMCFSCNYFAKKTPAQEVIAEVNDKTLLRSDVKDIFPAGIAAEDSLQLLETYVNNWARKQLIAGMAEQYLTKEQKDVAQEMEDYRLSLLVFRYEKLYLEQRLNTVVNEGEIEKLYRESPQNFILTKPIARVVLIQISEDVPQLKKIRQIYCSEKEKDRQELSQLCSMAAEKYTNFDEKWVSAEFLAEELPLDARQIEAEWIKGCINVKAGGYEYFVHLYDKMSAGEQSPLDYERATITGIILNKRKQELLKNLENDIFNDALNHKQLKIYIDKQ